MKQSRGSAQLSVQSGEVVRGYEIRRLPLGEYLQALEAVRAMPEKVLRACFPGEDISGALAQLRRIDADALVKLLLRAMQVAPGEAVKLIAVLTGVPEERLLTDPAIGLDGAAEMLEAFWRLNGVGNFIRAAGRMAAQLKMLQRETGSSG